MGLQYASLEVRQIKGTFIRGIIYYAAVLNTIRQLGNNYSHNTDNRETNVCI